MSTWPFRSRERRPRSATTRSLRSCCRKGGSPVNRQLIFLLPVMVITVFMVMAVLERSRLPDPATRGFVQRNGMLLATVFVFAVGFWTLLLITMPYLYM